ncbi:glycosyltransferase [Thermosulfurimonas marina]|uniref:Glycosyltransferase n=1 Tax=Thermosulfurimonas marina TaxID=2047767 RepID=A0A6H1WRL9_9BACT|nr:glycosyltransferase [Thermosulfurimonas marina]QJA05786.1 glycosyltransferase [Thermosulfurimonas marina]
MKGPLVSVILPTFNRARFLGEALESVFSQTYRPLEVIVVDEASADETPWVVSRFPVIYVRRPVRKGPAAARNRGLRLCRGELVSFLDSDDLWLPEKVARQVAFLREHPEAVAVQPEEIWIKNGRRVAPQRKHRKPHGYFFHRAVKLCLVSPSGVMLRRRVLEEIGFFDEEFPVCEDYELWLRLAARYPVYLLPEPLVLKRGGHGDQLSRTPGLDLWRAKALAKVLRDPALSPEMRLMALAEARRKLEIFRRGALKHGNLGGLFEAARLERKLLLPLGLPAP